MKIFNESSADKYDKYCFNNKGNENMEKRFIDMNEYKGIHDSLREAEICNNEKNIKMRNTFHSSTGLSYN